MDLYETPACERHHLMNIAELAIYHILYDLAAGSVHITPDGSKLYFIFHNRLVRIEAHSGENFNKMHEDEMNDRVKQYFATL